MSRVIARLMSGGDPSFSKAVDELEIASGRPGVDLQIMSEMAIKVREKIRELGLDPNDTTSQELYAALQALVARHDRFLAQAIGVNDPSNVLEVLPAIQKCVNNLELPRDVCAIKNTVAKRLLKSQPPRKIMKLLGYKSVDSMLKREHPGEIMMVAKLVESATWLARFRRSYRKLRAVDFEQRNVEIILLDTQKWGSELLQQTIRQRHNIAYAKEMGVVGIMPLPVEHMNGVTLVVLPLLLHYLAEVRLYSAYFKLHQVQSNFGETVYQALKSELKQAIMVGGQQIHWRVLASYFSRHRGALPEVFDPHVQRDDFIWRDAEEVLYQLEPALQFWRGLEYVAADYQTVPVSLNLLDNAISYCNGLNYPRQVGRYFQASLATELYARYLGQDGLRRTTIEQLTDSLINQLITV